MTFELNSKTELLSQLQNFFLLQEKKSVPSETLSQTLVQTPNFFRSCDSFSMKKIKYYQLKDKKF